MPAITIRGLIGSGAYIIAPEVARVMNVRYVDRQILSEVARHLDTSVEEVADIDHVPWGLRGRIAKELGRAFEQISAGPVAPLRSRSHTTCLRATFSQRKNTPTPLNQSSTTWRRARVLYW